MVRILAASDIHGDKGLAKKLAERAEKENVDLVILAGDLTMADADTNGIIGPFKAKGKQVLIVPGNHESPATTGFLSQRYNVVDLHGYGKKFGELGVFGCSGVNVGMQQMSEQDIYETLKQAFGKVKGAKKTIMVTHVHPTGSIIENFTQFFPGSNGVKKALDNFKPDIMLCGHVHEAEGIEDKIGSTRIINVGKQGKIIDI